MARDRGPLACVMGDMNLVRPLGQAGIRCAVVAAPGSATTFSRFTDHVVPWEGDLAAADTDDEVLVDRLLDFARSCDEPPVLFYQHDEHALFISRHRARLEKAFRILLLDAARLDDLVDKARFMKLAQELNLPVPATSVLDTAGPVPTDLPYPLVLKPPTRGEGGWTSLGDQGKAVRVDSDAELASLWPLLRGVGEEIVAQELIPGPESAIESYHAYVDVEGTVVGEFTGRKIRTFPREYGFTTSLVITDVADVLDLGRLVVQKLELVGVAKVDFKRAPDGRLRLLEINPRFNLWHYPGAVAGVNLPALVWADLAGRPRPDVPRVRAGVRWLSLRDRRSAGEAGVPLRRWLPWALRSETTSTIAWDDPAVLYRRVLWRLRHRGGR